MQIVICCREELHRKRWGKCRRGAVGRSATVSGGLYTHRCRWPECLHKHTEGWVEKGLTSR